MGRSGGGPAAVGVAVDDVGPVGVVAVLVVPGLVVVPEFVVVVGLVGEPVGEVGDDVVDEGDPLDVGLSVLVGDVTAWGAPRSLPGVALAVGVAVGGAVVPALAGAVVAHAVLTATAAAVSRPAQRRPRDTATSPSRPQHCRRGVRCSACERQ